MAQRRDANVLCQPAQQLNVDVVSAEHLDILCETDPQSRSFTSIFQFAGLLSVAVFENVGSLAPTVFPPAYLN
jgi:hypothetical protein